MTWIKRLDKVWIGFVIGLIFPGIIFVLYWLIFHSYMSFPTGFYSYLIG